jgi:hypothetical protein
LGAAQGARGTLGVDPERNGEGSRRRSPSAGTGRPGTGLIATWVLRRTSECYLEVFVANDTEPNFLFRIDVRGEFEEIELRAGAAYNDAG